MMSKKELFALLIVLCLAAYCFVIINDFFDQYYQSLANSIGNKSF